MTRSIFSADELVEEAVDRVFEASARDTNVSSEPPECCPTEPPLSSPGPTEEPLSFAPAGRSSMVSAPPVSASMYAPTREDSSLSAPSNR